MDSARAGIVGYAKPHHCNSSAPFALWPFRQERSATRLAFYLRQTTSFAE